MNEEEDIFFVNGVVERGIARLIEESKRFLSKRHFPGRIFRRQILPDLENPTGFRRNLLESLTQDSYRISSDVGKSWKDTDLGRFPLIPTSDKTL